MTLNQIMTTVNTIRDYAGETPLAITLSRALGTLLDAEFGKHEGYHAGTSIIGIPVGIDQYLPAKAWIVHFAEHMDLYNDGKRIRLPNMRTMRPRLDMPMAFDQ